MVLVFTIEIVVFISTDKDQKGQLSKALILLAYILLTSEWNVHSRISKMRIQF